MSEIASRVALSRLAAPALPFMRDDGAAIEYRAEDAPVAYAQAVALMEARATAIAGKCAPELVWLLEHPPLYTAGTSAAFDAAGHRPSRLPVHPTGRGGEMTYHGPGQRVAYLMLDLAARRPDLRAFVGGIEQVVVGTLARFGIRGERREDRVGVWVVRPDKAPGARGEPAEDKIAAIGIRVRRWVSFHGFSLNVAPDLAHYDGIVPCGITARHLGVTSLADLGLSLTMAEVDEALRAELRRVFGPLSQREG